MSVLGKHQRSVSSVQFLTYILVRANASENPRYRLTEEEMVSQMSALTLAGHETTANTVTWLLYELAKHPEFQDKLRVEIVEKRAEVNTRGDQDFTIEDFESMPLLLAAIVVRGFIQDKLSELELGAIIGDAAISLYRLSFAQDCGKGRHHPAFVSYHD